MTPDPRFVRWCPGCEWNIEPSPPAPLNRREGRRRDRARRRSDALFAKVRAGGSTRPDRRLARVGCYLLAGLVHATTLGLIALGGWLVLAVDGWLIKAFGLLLFCFGVVIRPRLSHLDSDAVVVDRDRAPALYALLDRAAADLGARPIDRVVLTGSFSASVSAMGIRRRRVLFLALPLWTLLDPQQRVAVLAHELAHDVNGDTSRGLFVGSALSTLTKTAGLISPVRGVTLEDKTLDPLGDARFHRSPDPYLAATTLIDSLFRPVQRGLVWCVRAVYRALESLRYRDSQGTEYRADALAAGLASSRAMSDALDLLLVRAPCMRLLEKELVRGSRDGDVWTALRERVAELPDHERERLRRLAARRGHREDSSHPPTALRIAMLAADDAADDAADRRRADGGGAVAAIRLAAEESDAIDDRLRPEFGRVAGGLRSAIG